MREPAISRRLWQDPRTPWLLGYLLFNVIAAIVIQQGGVLIGDTRGHPLLQETNLLIALGVTCAIYVLLNRWLFDRLTRLSVYGPRPTVSTQQRTLEGGVVGASMLVLQTTFMIFNLRSGGNIAGAEQVQITSGLSWVFVLLQADMLFFVYYGYYRESPLFKYNLAIFLVSNFARGWSGHILTIAFFELCRAHRRGRLNLRKLALITGAGLLAYPIILSLKWFIRTNGVLAFSDVGALASTVVQNLTADGYLAIFEAGAVHVVERLQLVSNAVGVMQYREMFQGLFDAGRVTPFWWEGLPQLALTKAYGWVETPTLGVAMADAMAYSPSVALGSWNMSPSLAGWVLLEPLWTPVFAVYIVFLCAASVLLAPGCNREGTVRDMVWYAWLVYLIPGWLAAFTNFIYALVLFGVVRALFAWSRRVATSSHSRDSVPVS